MGENRQGGARVPPTKRQRDQEYTAGRANPRHGPHPKYPGIGTLRPCAIPAPIP